MRSDTNCPGCGLALVVVIGRAKLERRSAKIPSDSSRTYAWVLADGVWNTPLIRAVAHYVKQQHRPRGRQSARELYNGFVAWAVEANALVPTIQGFGQALAHLEIPKRRTSRGSFYLLPDVVVEYPWDDDEQVSTAGDDDGRSDPEEGGRAAAGQQDH